MSLRSFMIRNVDRVPLPDTVAAYGVQTLCARTSRGLKFAPANNDTHFVTRMSARKIAEATDAANAQHYEVPEAFFGYVLGQHRKYSCCLFDREGMTLAEAEESALAETIARAGLSDGQSILELGCGWGSLSLYMAAKFPNANITGVSNSHSQRAYITAEAKRRGLTNLKIITCDINLFTPEQEFDRIVSVEMFEHVSNWRALLSRVREWLPPEGKLFLHVFSHHTNAYDFDVADKSDWIAQHFFTGGIMPSHTMIGQFSDLMKLEQEWRWSGAHYEKTALKWLENYDLNRDAITPILEATYGKDADMWRRRWRLFFLATAGLFGFDEGDEWGVSHYLLSRA